MRILPFVAAAFLLAMPAVGAPNINTLTSVPLKTLQMSSEIVQDNQDALQKISGDIARAYRLHRGSMAYEQPGKIRIEATVPFIGSGYYIINGQRKLIVAPFVHKVQDVTGAPGKKQTLLDFGVVPPELLTEYDAVFLRRESGLLCFQIMPKLKSEPLKDIVWIDPKTHVTVQRYNYNRDGKLIKWFLYKNPVLVAPGLYLPTRVELYNTQNQLAGATTYRDIHVNQPLSEDLFKI